MTKKKQTMILAVIGLIVLALLTSTSYASSEKPKFITITSYPIGSMASILATAFSNTIEKKTGIRARPTPADTDVGRLLPIKTGEAQIALITGATSYFASEGLGEFSAKKWGPQRLRLVFAGSVVHHGFAVRADSNIKKWSDLKGKRIPIPPGASALTVPAFLAYGNLTKKDVVIVRAPGYVGAIKMVMEKKADACHAAPVSGVMKQWEAAPYGLRYMPLDPKDKAAWERMKKYAPFMASPIWATYGALGEGGHKWLAYYPNTLITYDTVDEDTVYIVVKSLVDGRNLYKDVRKPSSEEWTLEKALDMGKPVYVPYHAGLIKYAKEQGKWTPELEAWQAKALKEEEDRLRSWKAKQ